VVTYKWNKNNWINSLLLALRWLSHHSALKRETGDAILIGASSVKHIEQNLVDLEKGPLRKFTPSAFTTLMLN
jgi:aryl-alcohol dehydrogenase-like predicted oxidoreductase